MVKNLWGSCSWSHDTVGLVSVRWNHGVTRVWACAGKCCHGIMVSTQGPTVRWRLLPAVPVGTEWHNTAASATPCASLREPPPPFPVMSLSTPHGIGRYRANHTARPRCRSLCAQGPQCIQFCQKRKFAHPMPLGLPEVIHFAWAHAQGLHVCQNEKIEHGHKPNTCRCAKSNSFCMGTDPMPSDSRKVINSALTHTDCFQFCKEY